MNRKLRQAASFTMSAIMLASQPGTAAMAQTNEYVETCSLETLAMEEEDLISTYAAPADAMVVYTQSVASNDSRIGNGSRQNPYNRFEDAVANVADGGTIIIKSGKSAFLNTQDEYGLVPFIIDKNITIKSDSDNLAADLVVRAGGIVLQADVTFENINFAFANQVHDSIIANGYSLNIVDCSRQAGTREVDLFAGRLYDSKGDIIEGALYDANGDKKLAVPKEGTQASITVRSTTKKIKTKFGKVFAGSTNGTFDKDVEINIENNGSLDIRGIYGCGAEETIAGNMFELEEPAPPLENPAKYRVDGNVLVKLVNYKTDVYGAGADGTEVIFETEYPLEYFQVKDIDKLSVTEGKIIPTAVQWRNDIPGDLEIHKGGELELTKIKNLAVEDFRGGGKLTLQREGLLTINGELSKTTVFQTVGGAMDGSCSGLVQNEHVYIETAKNTGDDDSFTFVPYFSQKSYALKKVGNEWKAQKGDGADELPEKIAGVEFAEQITTWDINPMDGMDNMCPDISFTFDGGLTDFDILQYIECNIYINGEKLVKAADKEEVTSEKYKMDIWAGLGDKGYIVQCMPRGFDINSLPDPGTYEIQIEFPLYDIRGNTTLKVVDGKKNDKVQIKDSAITMEMKAEGASAGQMATYGSRLMVDAAAGESKDGIMLAALQDEMELVVNGKIVATEIVLNNKAQFVVDVTAKNNFKIGDNNVKVLFGGTDVLDSSFETQVLKVERLTPSVIVEDIYHEYDGQEVDAKVKIKNMENAQPEIYYYTDSQYTEGKTSQAPINAGTYYIEVYLPETELTKEVILRKGTIEIEKATPSIKLIGDVVGSAGISDLKVWADMVYPNGGSTPIGQVKFECTDGTTTYSKTKKLSFGSASHTFTKLMPGEYEVTVSYIPEIEGYVDVNYTDVNGIQQTFEIKGAPEQPNEPGKPNEPEQPSQPGQPSESEKPEQPGKPEQPSEPSQSEKPVQPDGSGNETNQPEAPAKVTGIVLDKSKLSLNKHETYTLTATVTPNNAENKNVIWSSSDAGIASVDNEGKITAHQKGSAIITAAAAEGNFSASCTVQVVEPASSSAGGGGGGGIFVPSTPNKQEADNGQSADSSQNTETEAEADSKPSAGENMAAFTDAMSSWAKEDIQYVVEKGLFKGVSNSTFGSDIPMTRGMIVTVLHRMAGTPSAKADVKSYADIKDNAYYSAAIEWAAAADIVSGISENKFAPNNHVTREQLAVFLYRYALSRGAVNQAPSLQAAGFKDDSNISDWAKDAIYWAAAQGILEGTPNGKVNPKKTATRAEVAAMIHRFSV